MAGTNQITWENKVNTKTLDIPRINKIIDEDLNEIKTKFNALDTIVTDPLTGLGAVKTDQTDVENIIAIEIPTQSDQFTTSLTNVTSLATIYLRPETANIDFGTSGILGKPDLPIYDSFSIDGASVTNLNWKNKWEMFFSCDTVPTNISRPASYLSITGTILTGYANLNRLSFELDYVYNATTDVNELKVLLSIEQQEGANEDPDPPIAGDPTLLIQLNMLEVGTIDTNPFSLVDSSTYDLQNVIIENGGVAPTTARVSTDQGYSFVTATRGHIKIDPTELNGGALGDEWSLTMRTMSMLGANGSAVFFDCNDATVGDGLRIHCSSSNDVYIELAFAGTSGDIRVGTPMSFTEMQNWTFTFDGTNVRTYLNGDLVDTEVKASGRTITNTTQMRINKGYSVADTSNGSTTAHEYFEIRRRVMELAEITDLHNALDEIYNPST
jgi:hypothetical protein